MNLNTILKTNKLIISLKTLKRMISLRSLSYAQWKFSKTSPQEKILTARYNYWDVFCLRSITILRIPKESVCSNFFEAAIFLERLFLHSINCNYFFRAATSSVILENILRRVNSFQQNSYFFKLLSSSNFLMKSK